MLRKLCVFLVFILFISYLLPISGAEEPTPTPTETPTPIESPTPTPTETPTPTPIPGFIETDGTVAFEAEHFDSNISSNNHTWTNAPDANAAGGTYVNTANDGILYSPPNSAEAQYLINFQTTGTYYVWLRGYALSGTSNAIGVGLDGNPTTTPVLFGSYNSWIWDNTDANGSAVQITVSSPGAHIFSIWERKDGTRLDRIVLSTSSTPPSGTGPAESPRNSTLTPTPTPTATPSPTPPPTSTPNIIVFMVDDLAFMDERVWNRLPNIKKLFLDQGIRFDNYQGNYPLCCPGRANFLTGQLAHNNGVINNDARLLDARETVATELNGLGYYTGIIGKYLNHSDWLADKSPLGWDYVAIHENNSYYEYNIYVNDKVEHHASRPQDYSTDVFMNYSDQFFNNAPSEQPIFAFLTPYAAHYGTDENGVKSMLQPVVAPRYKNDPKCQGIAPWNPANYNENDVSDKPTFIKNRNKFAGDYTNGWPLSKVCGSLLSVDEWVGHVIEQLKAQGRYENTLFVLTGDNGMAFGAHRWDRKHVPYATQLPLYMTWVNGRGIEPKTNNTLIENIDMAPTFCEIAGCVMGPYPKGTKVDGKSFAGIIASNLFSSIPNRKSIILEHTGSSSVPRWKGIMTSKDHANGQWLYVWYYGTGEKELYNITGGTSSCAYGWKTGNPGDPCLLNNLAGKTNYASIRNALHNELLAIW